MQGKEVIRKSICYCWAPAFKRKAWKETHTYIEKGEYHFVNLNLQCFILDVIMSVPLFAFHLKKNHSNVVLAEERTCLFVCMCWTRLVCEQLSFYTDSRLKVSFLEGLFIGIFVLSSLRILFCSIIK